MLQKIAVVTEDNLNIGAHFGMAPIYQVFTIQDGEIVAEEQREKPHHSHHPQHGKEGDHDHHRSPGGHQSMFAPVSDCQVLLCGGMGQPAYKGALDAGLEEYLTRGPIRDQVQAFLAGTLTSDMRRVH